MPASNTSEKVLDVHAEGVLVADVSGCVGDRATSFAEAVNAVTAHDLLKAGSLVEDRCDFISLQAIRDEDRTVLTIRLPNLYSTHECPPCVMAAPLSADSVLLGKFNF